MQELIWLLPTFPLLGFLVLVLTAGNLPKQIVAIIGAGSVGGGLTSPIAPSSAQSNVVVDNQQRQGQTQLYGLFGLGGPEIGVILVAAAFLLGPQKLAELGKFWDELR